MSNEQVAAQNARHLGIRELRAICQATAPAPERETFTGKTARVFSIYFTKLFLLTSITPNQITFLSVIVFLVGVNLFLTGETFWSVCGALLVYFATVLDGCDGEVARFRKTASTVGGVYAEPVSHDVQYGLMFLPLGWAAMASTGQPLWLLMGFIASVSKLLTRLVETRFWSLKLGGAAPTQDEVERARRSFATRPRYLKVISWVKRNTLSSNGMILPLLLAAVFQKVHWYVGFYGAAYASLWIITFARQIPKLSSLNKTSSPVQPGTAE